MDLGDNAESDDEVAEQDRNYVISSTDESDEEEEESDEEDSEDELAKARADMEHKPGARDRYGKANKGIRNK